MLKLLLGNKKKSECPKNKWLINGSSHDVSQQEVFLSTSSHRSLETWKSSTIGRRNYMLQQACFFTTHLMQTLRPCVHIHIVNSGLQFQVLWLKTTGNQTFTHNSSSLCSKTSDDLLCVIYYVWLSITPTSFTIPFSSFPPLLSHIYTSVLYRTFNTHCINEADLSDAPVVL